jgi:hypothetical protein
MNKKFYILFFSLIFSTALFADLFKDAQTAIKNKDKPGAAKLLERILDKKEQKLTPRFEKELQDSFTKEFGVDYKTVLRETPPPPTPRPVTASNEYIALQTPPTDKSSAQKWLQEYTNLQNAINTGKYSGDLSGLASIHTNATKLAQAAPAPAPAPAPTGVNTANNAAQKAFSDVLTAADKIDTNKQNALAQSWGFTDFNDMKNHALKMKPVDIEKA